MSDNPVTVSKLDAAKRHLRTAIWLWFMEKDPVSVHALVSASHEVIHTLYKRKGLRNLFFDNEMFKEEYRSEIAKKMKEAATFFKHAQRDPDASHTFNPAINPFLFLIVISGLARMGEPLSDIETAFLIWFGLHNPRLLLIDIYANFFPADQLQDARSIKRAEFLDAYLQMRREDNLG